MAGRKRLDGVGKLTKAQKDERDARATYWMNQRKIERVAEAAARSGYRHMSMELVDKYEKAGLVDVDEAVITVPTEGRYRIVHALSNPPRFLVRKVESFAK